LITEPPGQKFQHDNSIVQKSLLKAQNLPETISSKIREYALIEFSPFILSS